MLNPYIAGAPVTETSMFFGRQDVFDWIERSLAGKYVDHILVVHGQRRVGKTSVLKQIPHFLPPRYVQVYFDLQGRTQTNLDRFLWWMGREIVRTLRKQLGMDIPRPEQQAFTQDSEYFYTKFLPELKERLDDRILLLTFDEFDSLSEADLTSGLGKALTDYLRQLFEIDGLNFIFSIGSSGKKLENMQAAYTEFFKAALYKKISFLSENDCRELITRPVESVLNYDPEAVERIYQITYGHPYYTQLTCHELFSNCQKTERKRISGADVESVLPDVVERGTVNLKFVWDEASPLEKWALACLAQEDGKSDLKDLAREIRKQRVRFSEGDLNSALLHLRERDILTENNQFIVDLMRRWLRTNRPLDRVREELVEVNPIAKRFIEIGDEYAERGESSEALQSYQQALSADPGNLKAQVSIASIHLAKKDYASASEAYDKALKIEPDDIQSRSGLCEAEMALGEQALSKGDADTALEHYKRVASINPEHSASRQQLSNLLCQRAERALTQGRDEEALKAFNTALDYTPEDEVLQARYEAVCERVKDKVLASLLKRAEIEQAHGNWEKAIQHLEDYLRFEHGDAEVVALLAEARRQQHLSQIRGLKAEAEEHAHFERWDEAIKAWETYLKLEPEDRTKALASLKEAERFQMLEQSYRQGQEALQKKDYTQAIMLFQSVIIKEPSYKDTARLLSEAIAAERKGRPAWLNPWVWAAFIFVTVTLLAGYLGRNALGGFANRLTLAQSAPTPTLYTTPVPAWIANFGEPLRAEIAGRAPDFEDDFSDAKPGWRLTSGSEADVHPAMPYSDSWSEQAGRNSLTYADFVTDGALSLEIEPESNLHLTTDSIQADNFALQYDVLVEQGGAIFIGPEFRRTNAGKYNAYTHLRDPTSEFYKLSDYMIMKDNRSKLDNLIHRYAEAIDFERQFTVLLLVKGNEMAIYIKPAEQSLYDTAGYVEDDSFTSGSTSLDLYNKNKPARVKLDNLKFWSLDEEQTSPAAIQAEGTLSPTSSPTPVPSWVTNFGDPALSFINDREPEFEDDFSEVVQGWQLSSWSDDGSESILPYDEYVKDGALRLEKEVQERLSLTSDMIQGSDFALQYEVFEERGFDVFISTVLRTNQNETYYLDSYPRGTVYNWAIFNELRTPLISGYSEYVGFQTPFQVLHIVKGEQMAVYYKPMGLNQFQPVGYLQDISQTDGSVALEFHGGGVPTRIRLDNIKFWKLDEFKEGTTQSPSWITNFGEPALGFINDRAPEFEDDFSEAKPEWQMDIWSGETGDRRLSIADYITEGVLQLELQPHEGLTLQADEIQATDFALEFEFIEDQGGDTSLETIFRESNEGSYRFFSSPIGVPWNWALYKETDETLIQEYSEIIGYRKPFKVLLIVKGDQIAVYLKPTYLSLFKPAGYVRDATYTDGRVMFSFGGGSAPSLIKLDSVKFWNLDEFSAPEWGDTSDAATTEQASLPTSVQPTKEPWIADFVEPILASLEEREPDFTEDFTDPNPLWVFTEQGGPWIHLNDTIENGALKWQISSNTNMYLSTQLMNIFRTDNYVLEWDFTPKAGDAGMWVNFEKGENCAIYLDINSQRWIIGDNQGDHNEGSSTEIGNKPTQIQIITQGNHFAVYLNGKLLRYHVCQSDSYDQNDFIVFNFASPSELIMDNIKFWELEPP